MLKPKSFAFVDESGDPSLKVELDGVSTHFVVAAVLVKGDEVEAARSIAEKVRQTHFGSGEMKSSGVGNNESRRLAVLTDLRSIPAAFYVFVADKREIRRDSGLIFKKPFLKFLTGKVYNRIFRVFPNLDVFADEHGSRSFMDEFEAYVRKNHQPTLFERSTFTFAQSVAEPLIQIADFVAGSVRRVFDPRHSPESFASARCADRETRSH